MPVMGVRVYVHTETTLTTIDKLFFLHLLGSFFRCVFFLVRKFIYFFAHMVLLHMHLKCHWINLKLRTGIAQVRC